MLTGPKKMAILIVSRVKPASSGSSAFVAERVLYRKFLYVEKTLCKGICSVHKT